jgi:hypothetical protein
VLGLRPVAVIREECRTRNARNAKKDNDAKILSFRDGDTAGCHDRGRLQKERASGGATDAAAGGDHRRWGSATVSARAGIGASARAGDA